EFYDSLFSGTTGVKHQLEIHDYVLKFSGVKEFLKSRRQPEPDSPEEKPQRGKTPTAGSASFMNRSSATGKQFPSPTA
ncbi:MAG: hypothetical protein LRY50_03570, partial [Geovibrio sp.]|nr:hypothetical protein [Geovibrio sp.]